MNDSEYGSTGIWLAAAGWAMALLKFFSSGSG